MHLSQLVVSGLALPVQAIGWGKKGEQAECLCVIPRAILGLFTWQWVAGRSRSSREEAGRLWTCSITSTSLCGQSKSLGQPRSMEQKKALSWRKELAKYCGSFCNSLFLILSFNSDFLCYPQGSQDQSLEWFYNNVKSKLKTLWQAQGLEELVQETPAGEAESALTSWVRWLPAS